jgi:Rrf2 family protein
MLLTHETDYALMCVIHLARYGHASTAEIARRLGLSASFLSNIVGALTRSGITVTRRGSAGGVSLSRPASSISVLDVVEAVQGRLAVNACMARPPQCDLWQDCELRHLFAGVQETLRSQLEVRMGDLCEGIQTTIR